MVRPSGLFHSCRRTTCLLIAGWGMFFGCSGTSELTGAAEGVRHPFECGFPELEIQAGPGREENAWGVVLTLVYPRSSLVFAADPAGYRATSQISVQLIDQEGSRLAAEQVEDDTILVGSYDATRHREAVLRKMFLPARPGSYLLKVSLRDGLSLRQSVAVRRVVLPDLRQEAVSIGLLSLTMGSRDGEQIPVPSFCVAADCESLCLAVDLLSAAPETKISACLSLLRCISDTTAALPPYSALPIGRTALVYLGVDRSSCDTVWVQTERGSTTDHWTRASFSLPQLVEGAYRIEVALGDDGGGESLREGTSRSRDLLVFCPGFPRPSTTDELIRPLVYLASEEEWDSLRTAQTPIEQRRRFETFWLSGAENRQRARAAIRQYYSRVEEANRMFSSHKEGWKTDRGMVYIICGPPSSSETVMSNETWYYPQDGRDAANAFRFETVSYAYGGDAPYENILLQRSEAYRLWWEELLWRWRNGIVP